MLEFKILYYKYWPRMAYYANKLINSKEEAEDIAQDVLASLYDHMHDIPTEDKAQAWLYICTRHKCLNQLNKIKQEHKRQPGYLDFIDIADPEVVDAEFITAMLACIKALPVERLKIFKLIFFEGHGLQQIADELHISINTVKSQRAKALIQLRKELK